MKITPKQLQNKLDKFYDEVYVKGLEDIAQWYFDSRILPYCKENKLSFTMMNGVPRFINLDNEYISLPKFMLNIVDIADREGNLIMWHLPDFKYVPEVDTNMADHKFWDARAKKISEQFNNDTTKMGLYLAFSV